MKTNSYSIMNKTTFLNVTFELWDQVLGIIATNNHKFQGASSSLKFLWIEVWIKKKKVLLFNAKSRCLPHFKLNLPPMKYFIDTVCKLPTNHYMQYPLKLSTLIFFFPSPRGCGDGSNVCPSSLANRSSRLERSSNHDRGTCDRWLERCHQIVCEQMTRSCPYLEYRWKLFSWSGKSSSRGYSNSLSNMMVYPDCERELRDNFLCVS